MDSKGQTRNLLSQQIKKEFECDIIYEPIKREMVEEDSSRNELDHDPSDSEDDVFYDTIEPGLPKKIDFKKKYKDFDICKSEKYIVEKDAKSMEEEPCKSHEFTDDISENDTGFTHDKNYNLSCHGEDMSESSGLESDLKNALENPTYEVDCDQKEGVLIMNMINEKFSLRNENSSSNSKNLLTNKAKCKTEIEDDIEIVYDDIVWEDSSENKALVISEVCKKSLGNETYPNNRKSGRIGRRGQNKVNLDSTDNVIQGENSSEEKMSCSSIEPTKDFGMNGVKDKAAEEDKMTNKHISTVFSHSNLLFPKDKIKLLKVLLHRNFGSSNSNKDAGLSKSKRFHDGDGSFMYKSPPESNELRYLRESRQEEPPFRCILCSKSFIHRSSLLRHHQKQHEENPQCAICSKTFDSKKALLYHIKMHKGELPFRCPLCSKCFLRRYSLSRHKRIHKRVNPYHCKVCPKSFFNKTVFTVHQRTHEKKLFNCNMCSQTFRFRSNLDYHIKNHSKHKKPFHCTFCPKSFIGRYGLATHERIHKGEKPFRCQYCPKSFSDKAHLPSHERTHSGERPFLCKICPKSFIQTSHLRTHERMHKGEKRFQCEICSKRFCDKYRLSLHERVHKSEKEKLRDDKYHCKICSKSFQMKSDFVRHENTHAEKKPFQCKFCSKSYAADCSLIAHERTHKHKKTSKIKSLN